MVLGPYGDLVTYDGAGLTYLSWYPSCLRGFSVGDIPPPEWTPACEGRPDPFLAEEVARETLAAFDELIPGLGASGVRQVDVGVICARGESDITDPESALHERHDIGVRRRGGYFTVSTGKFTSAPGHAADLVAMLTVTGA